MHHLNDCIICNIEIISLAHCELALLPVTCFEKVNSSATQTDCPTPQRHCEEDEGDEVAKKEREEGDLVKGRKHDSRNSR